MFCHQRFNVDMLGMILDLKLFAVYSKYEEIGVDKLAKTKGLFPGSEKIVNIINRFLI